MQYISRTVLLGLALGLKLASGLPLALWLGLLLALGLALSLGLGLRLLLGLASRLSVNHGQTTKWHATASHFLPRGSPSLLHCLLAVPWQGRCSDRPYPME